MGYRSKCSTLKIKPPPQKKTVYEITTEYEKESYLGSKYFKRLTVPDRVQEDLLLSVRAEQLLSPHE